MTSLAVPFTVSLLGRVIFGGCMAFAVGLFVENRYIVVYSSLILFASRKKKDVCMVKN